MIVSHGIVCNCFGIEICKGVVPWNHVASLYCRVYLLLYLIGLNLAGCVSHQADTMSLVQCKLFLVIIPILAIVLFVLTNQLSRD